MWDNIGFMLSLYRDFPDNDIIATVLGFPEAEFLFIVSQVPVRSESESPYSEDRTHIQLLSMPGVALRVLPDGELYTGSVGVRYPQLFETKCGHTVWDPREIAELSPFTVYRARGAYHFNEGRQEHYVDIWDLLPAGEDPEMEALTARIAAPVALDSEWGPLVLDRSTNTFDGRAEELGVDISIWYEGEDLILAEHKNLSRKFKSPLKVLGKVATASTLDKARRFAADKVLAAANRWREDVAASESRPGPVAELTAEDVYAALSPAGIEVPQRGHVAVEFDDGYLFGGHPVTVMVKRNGTPASVELDA